jgi:hypothetical protein
MSIQFIVQKHSLKKNKTCSSLSLHEEEIRETFGPNNFNIKYSQSEVPKIQDKNYESL